MDEKKTLTSRLDFTLDEELEEIKERRAGVEKVEKDGDDDVVFARRTCLADRKHEEQLHNEIVVNR